jgi:predicted DCC family thiol-disulfide oxidoreductase YuxK
MHENDVILFFDGVCGLCNGLVDWLLPRDTRQKLKFSTHQGVTAKKLLSEQHTQDLNTVVIWARGKILTRSEAILYCLVEIGGIWSLCKIFYLIPSFIRDGLYKFIAKNRYRFFGQRNTCRMPLPGERLRFLD